MNNSNEPIYPVAPSFIGDRGLTKREYFAAMALQGFLSADVECSMPHDNCAKIAVMQADALLKELDK